MIHYKTHRPDSMWSTLELAESLGWIDENIEPWTPAVADATEASAEDWLKAHDYLILPMEGDALRIADLYCGAGGAGMGLHRAGFDVVGYDINRQPDYPFEFHRTDALGVDLSGFDAVWASPPCQAYTRKSATWGRPRVNDIQHPDLVEPTRQLLVKSGLPYVIENVVGAPLDASLMLCGTMFGLRLIKHRIFESNISLGMSPAACDHSDVYNPWQGKGRNAEKFREAQGTPWIPSPGGASRKAGYTGDLSNAIPPAYSKHLGDMLSDAC